MAYSVIMRGMKIQQVPCPPLVGRVEAAKILGVHKQNATVSRIPELPPPLQQRGIRGFEVSAGPLWPRAEIVELARKRRAKG
jgi:hypothetical protein